MIRSVLLLLPGAFSGVGGIEMFNRQLVRASLELSRMHGFPARTLILNDRTSDVDDRYIPRGARPPRGFSRGKVPFGVAAIEGALRMKPDIILFGHVHFAILASVLKCVSPGSRHWYVVHGVEVWRPLPPRIRRGLSLADRVLSVSDFTRGELEKNGGPPRERIHLLMNSLDAIWQGQYSPRPEDPVRSDEGPPTLLTVARLDASERPKGIESVIRALPEVVRRIPDVVYEIVGDGDDRSNLEALATEMGVKKHVRFRGRLWPDELAAAYRDCSIFVMPSSKEGFGIVFLEAALFGKPSIAGRHCGSPEAVVDGETGILCDREDISGIGHAVARLLSEEVLRTEMGRAAHRRMAERFTYTAFRNGLAREFGVPEAAVDDTPEFVTTEASAGKP